MRDQSPNRRLAKAGLVIRWLTARPNAMYGSFARNTLRFPREAIGAAVISSWKGAMQCPLRRMTRAQPRGGSARLALIESYGCRRQRDVMAITQMRFRPRAGRDRFQISRAGDRCRNRGRKTHRRRDRRKHARWLPRRSVASRQRE